MSAFLSEFDKLSPKYVHANIRIKLFYSFIIHLQNKVKPRTIYPSETFSKEDNWVMAMI